MEAKAEEEEPCPGEAVVHVGKDEWRFEIGAHVQKDKETEPGFLEGELSVFKNGRLVRKQMADVLQGQGLAVRRMAFPTGYPVVAVQSYPAMGHASRTYFYAIRNGRLVQMGHVGAENGGPIFRDEDGDGKKSGSSTTMSGMSTSRKVPGTTSFTRRRPQANSGYGSRYGMPGESICCN